MTYQGINIYEGPKQRRGFHRIGSRYSPFIDPEHFLGIDPLEDTKLTRSSPLVNVKEKEDSYYDVEIAVAGYKKNDIDITLKGETLVIEGQKEITDEKGSRFLHREHHMPSFKRSITVSNNIDKDKIEARYENGILTVRFHMLAKGQSANQRKIVIK